MKSKHSLKILMLTLPEPVVEKLFKEKIVDWRLWNEISLRLKGQAPTLSTGLAKCWHKLGICLLMALTIVRFFVKLRPHSKIQFENNTSFTQRMG